MAKKMAKYYKYIKIFSQISDIEDNELEYKMSLLVTRRKCHSLSPRIQADYRIN